MEHKLLKVHGGKITLPWGNRKCTGLISNSLNVWEYFQVPLKRTVMALLSLQHHVNFSDSIYKQLRRRCAPCSHIDRGRYIFTYSPILNLLHPQCASHQTFSNTVDCNVSNWSQREM
jgi:hypothetical protein